MGDLFSLYTFKPRNRFRQPMYSGGPVRQPYSYSVPIAPIDCSKIPPLAYPKNTKYVTKTTWQKLSFCVNMKAYFFWFLIVKGSGHLFSSVSSGFLNRVYYRGTYSIKLICKENSILRRMQFLVILHVSVCRLLYYKMAPVKYVFNLCNVKEKSQESLDAKMR
jgi:hypothetical protein